MKPEIWGHRGAYAHAAENTLEGFGLALNMGADGVEFDIQLSKDGEIVVIYDETIDRTSDHRGRVCDYTLAQLKTFNFNKLGGTVQQPRLEIPTLREALELLCPSGITIKIELKTGVIWYEGIERKALKLVEKFDYMDKVIWSSFNHYSVSTAKQLEPIARTALLCGGWIFVTGEQCEKTGTEALHCNVKQMRYPGLVDDCHRRGVKLRAWTVNEESDFRFAAEVGVDAVITNRIERGKKICHE